MNLSDPMSSVIAGVPGVILSILARTDQPLTGLTVANLAGNRASAAGVTRAMRPLVEAGLVDLAPAGRAHLYSLNREHVAYPAIAQLAGLRGQLYHRIGDAVTRWSPPAMCVGVFGSTVRGHAGPASDIDLLVVRHDDVSADDAAWARQVAELSGAVARWAGNGCDVLEYDLTELRRLHDDGEPVVRALERDVVVLHGVDLRSMLAAAAR
jgi:predicted nucleotidyltransferase